MAEAITLTTALHNECSRNPGVVERLVRVASPAAYLSRRKHRLAEILLRYEGAEFNRLRNLAPIIPLPVESSVYSRDRVTLLAQARDLEENFPFITGILRKYVVYVVGCLSYRPRTGDDKLDAQIRDYFCEGWMKRCDISGRHNLRQLMQLAIREEKRSGDCGFIWVIDGLELKLMAVESDRIGNPYQSIVLPDYVNGIVIDPATGKPLAYRIFQRSRQTAMYYNPVDVPASQFLHYFEPERTDQFRGVTAFHSCMNTARDIKEMEEAMRIRMKYAAYMSALITTMNGLPDINEIIKNGGTVSGTDNCGQTVDTPLGRLRYLAPGEDVKEMRTEFPAANWQAAVETLCRDIANSLNLSYELLRNIANPTGPGVRAVLAQDDREFYAIRENMEDRLLNPIRNRVLFHAASTGLINCAPRNPALYQGKWFFPSKVTIDVGREADADIKLNAAGMQTLEYTYGEIQEDWRDQLDQAGVEQAYREQVEQRNKLAPGTLRIMPFRTSELPGNAPAAPEPPPGSNGKAALSRLFVDSPNGHGRS